MKDFLIDSNTVYEKGMQGYTALTIIEENLNRLDELLKEASNEINKHDELNRMYYQSLESDIQYLRDYQNKYQSFIGGTYNVNGDGGFVGEYKDTVDDPYYKQKEALLDKLGDLKLEDITVDNKLGISANMQAFVGHTTMVKDKVNIRDILGFGNISDNIKKQYEESKALIEKYNEGLNTYNESDYPSILPGFAKKIWYNLTKKKEKTIDSYDDYLDAIIKSGDFNFETEGEKKLSIGLDFIPLVGIGKMALEGLLGEDLVSGKDLNGLERILAVAPAGVGALSKVKNAIKLGEIGGKVEGSISFGMNGGGQIDNIISKLKESKAEEDLVAKEAVTIDNGAAEAVNLWKESTCSIDELHNYLLKNVDSDAANIFLNDGKWPEGIQIPKNSSVLNADGSINWSKAAEGGYTLDTNGDAIKDVFVPKIGEVIDRYGNANGRYTSPVINGESYSYTQRSLPYVEDLSNYHQYEVTGDFSKIEEYVNNCSDAKLKAQIDASVTKYYDGDYSKLISYKGGIAEIDGWGIGGGTQYEFSLTVDQLERLGLLKEIN
jgi:hypothetical protein